MALQVRLRHPLGEKLIDLESRGPENPLIVGRAGDAHVQIPSTQVAPVHCHLFEHDGQWIVADAGGGQICVNGHSVDEPTVVQSGDVITLGRGGAAPRLEIDPLGLLQRASAAAAAAAPPAVGTWQVPQPEVAEGFASVPPDAPAPRGEWDFQAVPANGRYYVPKRQKSGAMVGIAIAACAVAALAGGLIIYSLQSKTAPKPAPKAPPEPKIVVERSPAPKSKPNHIFDFGEPDSTTPPQTSRTVARGPDPTPVVPVQPTPPDRGNEEPPTSPPPVRPATADAAWMEIIRAKRTAPLPIKIYKFLEYADEHPDSPRLPELEAYMEEEMDLMWWFRIKELCDRRDDLQKRIDKASTDLAEETNPEWRKKIEDDIARLTSLRQRDLEVLTREMGYREKQTPNLYDQEQLARLRATRDADAAQNYAKWKEKVKLHVKRTRGQLPWEMAR